MKKIITLVLVFLVMTGTQMLEFLPWWSFCIPIFLLGFILPLKKWKVTSFFWGFIAGFLNWVWFTIYFEKIYQGEIIASLADLIDISTYMLYAMIGSIGGGLAGLALYSGFLLRKGKEILHFDLPEA